jgi:hypothetical protein
MGGGGESKEMLRIIQGSSPIFVCAFVFFFVPQREKMTGADLP